MTFHDTGAITSDVAKSDFQVQVPLAPAAYSTGTWTASLSSNVLLMTRTPANTTEYYQMPIIFPCRTTALKGAKLKSVTVVVALGGTLDTANDDFEINILKVTTPVEGSAPVGSVLAGDAAEDYVAAYDTKAERLVADDHTFVVTIPTIEQAYATAGEQYYVRVKVTDNAGANLTCVLEGCTAQFDVNYL
jgi:hypothetical protein